MPARLLTRRARRRGEPSPSLETRAPGRLGRALARAVHLLPLALLAVAAVVLHRELAQFHWSEVAARLSRLSASRVALAAGITLANYLLLTAYDWLGVRLAGARLPLPRVALGSFIANAFGHNVGMSVLSSGSVRFRLYSAWGLTAPQITEVVAVCAVTFWTGILASAAWSLPLLRTPLLGVSPHAFHLAAALCAALIVGYLALCARASSPLRVGAWSFATPTLPVAALQVAVAAVDWLLSALVLLALLPASAPVPLATLVAVFVVAQVGGLLSQVPAGLGVFESVVVAALAPTIPAPEVLATLIVYRLVYYLGPFLAAALTLAGNEVVRRHQQVARVLRGARASFAPIVPVAAAAAAFVSGAVLLFSGATPAVTARLRVLEETLPLSVIELSHLLSSCVGVLLILVARGLQRRLDGAWVLAIALCSAGIFLSLFKGIDYEEALILTCALLVLLPFHQQFYRRTSLFAERFSPGWVLALAVVLGTFVWLGFFSYRHVEYREDLWWRFAFLGGDAPRFLRAMVAVAVALFAFATAQLLRPAPGAAAPPGPAELARAQQIADREGAAYANLALIGDKGLLFSADQSAFLMYGVERRTWVSMGDPVGPERAATDLAWDFRALADRHHGWTCFYQVGPQTLPRYLDMGLALLKLGEEAMVPLTDFCLGGRTHRCLRAHVRRAEREGLEFELVGAERVPALLPELRAISDEWLEEKRTREKCFSLGFFNEAYLSRCPMALALHGGRVVAFANVWAPSRKVELSVDLMRFRRDAPAGVMDFLFAHLMAWGREQGYERFNLGMAPFSGFDCRALAPLWLRVGSIVFRYGEHFYNFQGLRQYKEKFRPEWVPRYLAAPGGLALPRILANIAALVSRGIGGVVAR